MSVNDKAVFKLATNIGEYENLINQNPDTINNNQIENQEQRYNC